MAEWVYDDNDQPVPDCKRCPRREDESYEQYLDCQDCYVAAVQAYDCEMCDGTFCALDGGGPGCAAGSGP